MSNSTASQLNVVGLVATNSPSYVRHFCEYLASGTVVVPIRSMEDHYRIRACGLTELITPEPGYGWTSLPCNIRRDDTVAWIAFTSGTQGEPKGVVVTHANISNTIARLTSIMHLDSSIREYVGMPVYHSFGLGRCLSVASVGGQFYLPRQGFNLHELSTMLAAGEVNAISAVPTLWRTVLRNRSLFAPHAHHVRWIEIGSQPMSAQEKLAMRELFPQARIIFQYGLTEAARSTFLDVSAAPARHLDSVGSPIGDVEIALTGDDRIKIRGGNVANWLVVDGKYVANVDAEGWFVTSDVGRIADGQLCFDGRGDDVINSGGIKISADALEVELGRALPVGDEVCIARIPDPERGDGVLVALSEASPAGLEEVRAAVDAILRRHNINAGSSIRAVRVGALPKTDTGKVMRNKLVAEFAALPPAHAPAQTVAPIAAGGRNGSGQLLDKLGKRLGLSRSKPQTSVQALFAKVFPSKDVGIGDTFVDLGGDSLNFVEISSLLEDHLGRLPDSWPTMSIGDLAKLEPKKTLLHDVETTLLLRFISILAIVTFHFTTGSIGGSAFLLLVVAGYNFSRFQNASTLRTNNIGPIISSTLRVALPVLCFLFLIQAKQGHFRPIDLAILGNFEDASTAKPDVWFVVVLVQMMLIMALILSTSSVRRLSERHPKLFAIALLAIAVGMAQLGPVIWDTNHLYHRVPHMLMWLFLLGWVHQQASRPWEKLGAFALAVALPLYIWGVTDTPFWVQHAPLWISAGSILLLWVGKVSVPFPLNRIAYEIGGASMFIYITHEAVRSIWQRVTPLPSSYLDIAVAVIAGIVVWRVWEAASNRIIRYASSWRITGSAVSVTPTRRLRT